MQVNVHAVSSPAMVAAIDAGVTRLVHIPNKDFTSYDVGGARGADRLDRRRRSPSARRTSIASPPRPRRCSGRRTTSTRFRDGKPWPEAIPAPTAIQRARGRHRGRLLDRQRPPHLGRRPDPSDDLVFHRPERRRPRRARTRTEVVQRHVLDGRHPPISVRTRRTMSAWPIKSGRSRRASSPTSS